MMRLAWPMTMAGMVLLCTQAPAGDFKGQPIATKRQMVSQVIDCMKKRMGSDRLISYNEAAKRCKDEVTHRLDAASTGPLVAADSPGK
jgi:hypothetical protein